MDGSSTMASIDALEKADLMGLLNQMLLYRRFEEKAGESYAIGKIGGFCHLHIGQEAVAAGCITPLRKDDYAIGTIESIRKLSQKECLPGQ